MVEWAPPGLDGSHPACCERVSNFDGVVVFEAFSLIFLSHPGVLGVVITEWLAGMFLLSTEEV